MKAKLSSVPPATVSLDELIHMDQAQLKALFAGLPPPGAEELDGAYHGRLLTTAGLDLIPDILIEPVRDFLQGDIMPWRGKRFEKGKGANYWLRDKDGFDLVSFDTLIAPALDGSGDVLQLDYDVERNPRPARRITGEVRRISDGLYLARMNFRIAGRVIELLYFTLEKQ